MLHPIEEKLAGLRSRVRLLVVARGISAVLSTLLAAAIVLGAADYLFRFEDRGLRITATLALVGALIWGFYRFYFLPAAVRLRDVDLAVKLQRRFPVLEDRLLSAVEFIAQAEDDPTAGSPVLRRSIIARTTAEAARLDFKQAVNPRPAVNAALAMIAVCLVAAMLAIFAPSATRTAVARLLSPLGDASWPRNTHLAVRNHTRIVGRGGTFEIEVFDSAAAPLPDEVRIHYRFTGADGRSLEESALMHQTGDTAAARMENVTRPFSYRVEGGDDRSMPWAPVKVVERPAVDSVVIRLIPPDYTGWPPEKVENNNNVRALAGTRMEIEAKAAKPLRSAALSLDDGREFPGRLSADGLGVAISDPALTLHKSCSYWFRLVDRDGLAGGENDRWGIVAVADSPPSVVIEQPSANLYVSPQAVVPLRIVAKDDLAVRGMDLEFIDSQAKNVVKEGSEPREQTPGLNTGSGNNGEQVPGLNGESDVNRKIVPLYAGPKEPPRQAAGGFMQSTPPGRRRVVDYRWQLAPLRLSPGMEVVFQAAASDYLPQTARSEPRRLLVVTPREIEDRIARRQGLLLSELDRALKMQRAGRSQVQAAEIRLDETKRPDQSDLDRLRAAELGQRQVNLLLTGAGEGIPSHVSAMLADLENNRIDNPELKRRLNSVLDEIRRLREDQLPVIGRELTLAVKSAEIALGETSAPAGAGSEFAAALAAAGKNQDRVVAALEKLIADLTQWEGSLRFQRDLSQLLRRQEQTARQTAETGRRTLGKEPRDLAPQDAADLRILASNQSDHARALERIFQDMDRAGPELQEKDPLTAKIVTIALEQAGRMGIGGQMRSCSDNLRQNQIGRAAEQQLSIIENLRQIIDILIHQSTWQSFADQAAGLEKLIKDFRKRQENIYDETRRLEQERQSQGQFNRDQLAAILDLAKLQRSMQIDAVQLGGQLGAASAAFALALDRASGDMDAAAGFLERNLTAAETQRAQQNALRRLDLLLEALKTEPQENLPNQNPGEGNKTPPNADQTAGQGQNAVNLRELKLLKMLQQEINRRTEALSEAIGPNAQGDDKQRQEYEQLAEEQAKLAELILKMLKEK
jgi:hypothetical protein